MHEKSKLKGEENSSPNNLMPGEMELTVKGGRVPTLGEMSKAKKKKRENWPAASPGCVRGGSSILFADPRLEKRKGNAPLEGISTSVKLRGRGRGVI